MNYSFVHACSACSCKIELLSIDSICIQIQPLNRVNIRPDILVLFSILQIFFFNKKSDVTLVTLNYYYDGNNVDKHKTLLEDIYVIFWSLIIIFIITHGA